MDSHTIFALLRDALAELYPEEKDSRVVVADAGLDAKAIAFSTRAQTNWHNILAAAAGTHQLDALLQGMLKDYGNHQALVAAYAGYRLFIDRGGQIEPPAQLLGAGATFHQTKTEGGAAVAGNVVTGGGTFIGRDQNIQGDLVQGNKIIQEAPKPHIHFILERPPRAEHFVNRITELAQLLADLQPGKVATLCGPGGIGKTALAAEAVWQLAPGDQPPERFPDGILFHSFYNQPQAALALEHIARSFGEDPNPNPKEAAQRALNGRCALVLLDGAEAADDLQLVLNIRNQCGVLVTSRQRKDAVDVRQDVAPLPPDEAVTLLQAWGGLRAADSTAVAQITEFVGRLPLAVRLVGRYLAENEENAIDYLIWLAETPLAALNQGQRRLDSVPFLLARSLAQVSEQARQVLGVIGLLALAPFTWETVAAALTLSDGATRRALGELVNYGLVLRPGETYEVTHALIHTYARLQLAPALTITHELGTYYAQFVTTNRAEFAQLNHLRPHMMALLRICHDQEAWQIANELAWALGGYLDLHGYWADRVTTLDIGLAAARALQERQDEGAHLGNLGAAYRGLGQVEQAIDYYQQALAIAQAIGDRRGEGAHLSNLGNAYGDLGQVEQAIDYYQQALAIAQEIGDRHGEGVHLGNLGNAYRNLGQVEQAIEYTQQALVIAQHTSDRRNESTWLGNLGNAYGGLGQVEQAIDYYQHALAIAQEIGDRGNEGAHLGNLGNAYGDLGQVEQAIDYYQQALAIAQAIGDRHGEGVHLGNLGNAYRDLGQVEQAIDYYQQALAIAQAIGDRRGEGARLGNLGIAYRDLGQVEQAIDYYQHALAIVQEIGDRRGKGTWLGNLGIAYRGLGQVEQAIDYYQQALAIAQAIGDRRGEGAHLGNLGNAYRDLGQVEQAIDYYQQALAIAQAIGDRRGEGAHLGNLGIAYRGLGQIETARQYVEQALQILMEIKSPHAEIVRGWLEAWKEN